jgi:hypothetical protein
VLDTAIAVRRMVDDPLDIKLEPATQLEHAPNNHPLDPHQAASVIQHPLSPRYTLSYAVSLCTPRSAAKS